jgi:DNA-binding SARP family transcriptional activator
MLRVFGAPHLLANGGAIQRLPAKAYIALALLPLRFANICERSALAAALWEDAPQSLAHRSLRQLAQLVREVERENDVSLLTFLPRQVVRGPQNLSSDLDEFLRINAVTSRPDLERVLELYAGDLLAFGSERVSPELAQWIAEQRDRLRDRFRSLAVTGAMVVGGQTATDAFARLVVDFPYDEAVHRSYFLHLSRISSGTAVRQAYEYFRNRLLQDLEVEPEMETRAVVAQLVPRFLPLGLKPAPIQTMPISHPPESGPMASPPASLPRVLILPPQPGPYVLDPRQLLLAHQLIDDVTVSLCRMRSFAVVAPHTARQLADGDPFSGGLPYQADYVVHTRLTPDTAAELRLGISLTRTATQEVLLGESLRFATRDLPRCHTDLVQVLIARLANRIETAEIRNFRSTGMASAYVHFLLGIKEMQTADLVNTRRARKHFQRALALSDDFVPARSMLARTLSFEWMLLGRSEKDLLHESRRLAQASVESDPFDPHGHRELGNAALYLAQFDESLEHLHSAVDRAPHHADILINYADTLIHSSHHGRAGEVIEAALLLNPLAPDLYYWIGASAEFFLGHYRGALDLLDRMRDPKPVERLRACCLAMLGENEAAARSRSIAMARQPTFRVDDWHRMVPLKSKRDTGHFTDALLRAGFPRA